MFSVLLDGDIFLFGDYFLEKRVFLLFLSLRGGPMSTILHPWVGGGIRQYFWRKMKYGSFSKYNCFLHLCRAAIYVILLIFCSWVLASVYSSTAQFLKDSLLASLVCLLLMCIKEGFMEPRASLRLAGFDALKFGDAFF